MNTFPLGTRDCIWLGVPPFPNDYSWGLTLCAFHAGSFCGQFPDTASNGQNNVLIDDAGHAQITDFGLTNFADATQGQHSLRDCYGSINWMAPELHYPEKFGLQKFQRTEASDVYALACLYWEVGFQKLYSCESACLVTTVTVIHWRNSISRDAYSHGLT